MKVKSVCEARLFVHLRVNVKLVGKIMIEYINMPDAIRDQFKYRTCAKIDKIRDAGYSRPITSLEDATTDYIQNYLLPNKRLS